MKKKRVKPKRMIFLGLLLITILLVAAIIPFILPTKSDYSLDSQFSSLSFIGFWAKYFWDYESPYYMRYCTGGTLKNGVRVTTACMNTSGDWEPVPYCGDGLCTGGESDACSLDCSSLSAYYGEGTILLKEKRDDIETLIRLNVGSKTGSLSTINPYYTSGDYGGSSSYSKPIPPQPPDKNCESLYGKSFTSCSNKDGVANCCASGEQCCKLNSKAEPVCCNSQTSLCASNTLLNANYCNYNDCKDPKPVLCFYDTTACCAKDEICTYFKTGAGFISKNIAVCIKKDDDNKCSSNEFKCGSPGDGVLCCIKGKEECTVQWGYAVCSSLEKGCDKSKGETFSPGKKDYKKKFNRCCPYGSTPFNEPDGYPRCIDANGKSV